jgi:eukaryotic-like serine/threonine-protein kinase
MACGNPQHTLINSVLVPIVKAGVELGNNQPARAIEHLAVVAPYELGFIAALIPVYLRAHAYLKLGLGFDAAAEFQRILDHRGSDPFSAFHAVAPLGLARAHAMVGNVGASVEAYERFLTNWRDADVDIPVLRDARAECRRLKLGMP